MHLVSFIIGINHDVRSSECQIMWMSIHRYVWTSRCDVITRSGSVKTINPSILQVRPFAFYKLIIRSIKQIVCLYILLVYFHLFRLPFCTFFTCYTFPSGVEIKIYVQNEFSLSRTASLWLCRRSRNL